ncbi:hypothetical protein [Aristaeella lactis]|uniref:Uncharacterized protein n=1 Tax=Aristaeella lactis TaxID=3046383 RepID=A0AC61PKV9_9FIRM|nr:hypothetical protein [Aristaeella lactis]QUA52086.1 hypothetical protein JYE50_10190 [Aristaeella lactis]SMC57641.1 hypothetical protein SAMN06297397_1459 [Aristaeella lactis]
MKRITVLLLLILCLPCLAAADTEYCTISQVRKQAETLADGTIEIETLKGRYTVSLEIPDVEQIPVITIALPKPDQAPPVPEGGSIEERRPGNAGYMTGWSVQLKKEQVAGTPIRGTMRISQYGLDAQADGSPLTMAEAIAFADQALNPKDSSPAFRMHRAWANSRRYREKGRKPSVDQPVDSTGYYSLEYEQVFHGIPCYGHISDYFAWFSDYDRQGILPHGQCTFHIFSPDCYWYNLDMSNESGVLAEDIPLCPLSAVIEALKQSCGSGINLEPIKPTRLRLVYLSLNDPENRKGDPVLLPYWVLEDDDDPESAAHMAALVNAQTGLLIDTDAPKDKGQRSDAVWITWDDV